MAFFKSKQPTEGKRYIHNLKKGDHVTRWTVMVVYPIQVHGIVLSASDDVVTIVDFGLTASSSSTDKSSNKEARNVAEVSTIVSTGTINVGDQQQQHQSPILSSSSSENNDIPLEAMMNHEDRAIINKCEKHRHEMMGPDRINVLVLTEEKDIEQWNKVEYKIEQKKKGGWFWQGNNKKSNDKKKQNREEREKRDKSNTFDEKDEKVKDIGKDNDRSTSIELTLEKEKIIETIIEPPIQNVYVENNNETKCIIKDMDTLKTKCDNENAAMEEKDTPEALLTRSDPVTMVIARVRWLMENPHVLPPHNIFYSNSECIAVWCKTGVWSTLQASVYLHTTAAGNLKTVVTAAAAVGSSTVTTTVPASGIAGWFGMTTTATVSLVSLQPWLIPAIAGYGLVAIGTPFFFLKKCHERWRETTKTLNDKFWGELNADVYVEAIKSWSGL